jgi:3-oxoacyl-[acyl-carrier-protein] synthase II
MRAEESEVGQRSARRVVITGLGVISPLGITPDTFWEALLAGRSGVTAMPEFPAGAVPMSFGAPVRAFTGAIDDFGPLAPDQKKAIRKAIKMMCRESQLGVAAAQRALDHAGIKQGGFDPERGGVVYGSDYMITEPEDFTAGIQRCLPNGVFDFSRWAIDGMTQMTPLWLLKYLPNMPASHIAIYNDLRGPNNSLTQREASANLAVGEALRVIQRGHAELMLAGATGTRIHPMKLVHAVQQEPLATDDVAPEKASRPFDLNRTGQVLGEGAGAVILEELEHARQRGATIYAEVVGASSSSASGRNFVARRELSLTNAMRGALRDAGATPADVGHVQSHGLSTIGCDHDEAKAMQNVFDADLHKVPVTAAKSYFGHVGAGSGLLEMIAGVCSLHYRKLFPILNYETPDPDCPIRAVRDGSTSPGDSFLNPSVTPQGQASCVYVRRYVE